MRWELYSLNHFSEFKLFLLRYEINCISIINKLYKEKFWYTGLYRGEDSIYILEEEKKITGVCYACRNGLLLPAFAEQLSGEYNESLIDKVEKNKIRSVMGSSSNVDQLIQLLQNKHSDIVEYHYMIKKIKPVKNNTSTDTKKQNNHTPELQIILGNENDCQVLFPLQKKYELEEVILDPRKYNDINSFIHFQNLMEKELVYFLRYKDEIVSKCNSNAQSPNFIQIGGMYTLKKFRGKGFGSMVLKQLIQYADKYRKNTSLFVKKNNAAALELYKKLGFTINNEFKIFYHREK